MVEPSTPEMNKSNKNLKFENGQLESDAELESHVPIPTVILKRVNALKNIQLKMVDIETKFYEELHQLECKYAALYEPLFDQREKIINGEHEPNEEESKWALDEPVTTTTTTTTNEKNSGGDVTELVKDLENKIDLNESSTNDSSIKGIPDFWLQTFKCTDLIGEMIQEYDEPVLRYLKDIRVKMHDKKPFGYTLEFYFNQNEYFSNRVLTKTYELTCDKDDKDPFSYDGPVMYKCIGCKIDWVKGKDVTVRLVKKKQKHKNSGTIRVITKEEKQDSFFNFFDTPTSDGLRPSFREIIAAKSPEGLVSLDNKKSETADDDAEDDENLCEADFEIGHFFKEFMVPKAVLYFTGELTDEDDEYDEYDEGEEEIDEGDDDGDEEGDDYEDGDDDGNNTNISGANDDDQIEVDDDDGEEQGSGANPAEHKSTKKSTSKSKNPKSKH